MRQVEKGSIEKRKPETLRPVSYPGSRQLLPRLFENATSTTYLPYLLVEKTPSRELRLTADFDGEMAGCGE